MAKKRTVQRNQTWTTRGILIATLALAGFAVVTHISFAQSPTVRQPVVVTIPAGTSTSVIVDAFCLNKHRTFPGLILTPGDIAPPEVRLAISYSVARGYTESVPYQVQLAIWYLVSGQWHDGDHALAEEIVAYAQSGVKPPDVDLEGSPLPTAVSSRIIVATIRDFHSTTTPKYRGQGTLVLSNLTDSEQVIHFPYGTIFQAQESLNAQNMVVYAVEPYPPPVETVIPTSTPQSSPVVPTITTDRSAGPPDALLLILLEMVLACALAAVLGYLLDKFKGAAILGGITLVASALTLLPALPIAARTNLSARPELAMLEMAIWAYPLAAFLGYLLSRVLGTLIVEAVALLTAFACIYLTLLAGALHPWLGALVLLATVVLIGTVGVRFFSSKILRRRGAKPLATLWFGFCITCLIGYWAAGRLGTFFIALPTQWIFWGFLYFFSGHILPLQDDERAKEEGHRKQAFRSLLTFALGTNYPFYVIEDWKTRELETHEQEKPDPRVPGNAFSQFLAGPGIIINDANHVAMTSTGFKLRVVPPGLSFTGLYEELYAPVDLRPQLRACNVQAETEDGIVVQLFTFMPNRIGTGGRQPTLGRSYPYSEPNVKKAVFHERPIEHTWARDDKQLATEGIEKIPWEELVLVLGPPILKDIILKYTCNELHAPGNPRAEIAAALRNQLREKVAPLGIELVGAGISDIMPPDEVVEQRIGNWEAKWKQKIEIDLGEIKAEWVRQRAAVWTQAQLQMMDALARMLDREALELSEEALAFQLIDALTMIEPGESPSQLSPPEDALIEGMRRGR